MALMRRSDFPNFPSLLDNFFGRDMLDFDDTQRTGSMPAVNIKEGDSEYNIEVAAPGMEKGDFKLHLDNNILTISSEKEQRQEEKNDQGEYTRREFSYQSFRRSFTLPDSANSDSINASYKEGILHIEIPKKEEAKKKEPRTIDIS